MLYTSYYGKYSRLRRPNSVGVQISNTCPEWCSGMYLDWREYAPAWSDIKAFRAGEMTEEEFKSRYLSTLDSKFDKADVQRKVGELLQQYDEVVFLCYERIGDVCHRHWFAEWLELDIAELMS